MLRIRIDGQDVETTPALLAKLVFDGKVDQHSVTKLPGGTTEQPLEQALGAPHAEALTAELHRRLGLMCSMDATAVDVQELCARVEGLCRWRWGNLPAAARFFWAAGWLNELADRATNAVEFYDAFLLPSRQKLWNGPLYPRRVASSALGASVNSPPWPE